MYDNYDETNLNRTGYGNYYSYSTPTPPKPEDNRNKKKKGGFFKKALVSLSLGLFFGLFAGAGFYAVNTALDYLNPDETMAASASDEVKTTQAQPEQDVQEPAQAVTADTAKQTVTDVSSIVENAMPSVVALNSTQTVTAQDFWGQTGTYTNEGAGSGIIVGQNDTELLIATNNHVVSGADTLSVQFIDDETVEAQIKGTDSTQDLAVIAVALDQIPEKTKSAIQVAVLGDSDSLKVGEAAIAIGNSLGYGQSVTTGVISAVSREVRTSDDGSTSNLIQTDAAINMGNSGGALLNIGGEVIGINSMKLAGNTIEGMSYAIPISSAKPIIDELMNKATKKKVADIDSSYLGISGVDVTQQVSEAYGMPIGVYVAQVYEGTAAENAGIVKGDIITAFDGEKVASMEDLQKLLQYYAAGSQVKVTVQSGTGNSYAEREVTVLLGRKIN